MFWTQLVWVVFHILVSGVFFLDFIVQPEIFQVLGKKENILKLKLNTSAYPIVPEKLVLLPEVHVHVLDPCYVHFAVVDFHADELAPDESRRVELGPQRVDQVSTPLQCWKETRPRKPAVAGWCVRDPLFWRPWGILTFGASPPCPRGKSSVMGHMAHII